MALSPMLPLFHVLPYFPILKLSSLTPKGPMSVDGFLGSLGRLSRRQKHE
jgi:hypothetical protein